MDLPALPARPYSSNAEVVRAGGYNAAMPELYIVERRRWRRWKTDEEVALLLDNSAVKGTLVDESEGGCRVRHSLSLLPPELTIRIHGQAVIAHEIWSQKVDDMIKSGFYFPNVALIGRIL
jgi:hypothetical protein